MSNLNGAQLLCLSVDDISDQCLFTSKSDPLKGKAPLFLNSTVCNEKNLVFQCELLVTVSLSWSHLFFQLFSQGAFGYVLPIISFILAWIETWFLDFKVLPQEAEEENSKLLSE